MLIASEGIDVSDAQHPSSIDWKLRSIDGGQGERNSEITWRDRRVGWDEGSKKYWTYRGDTIESRDRPVTYWVDLGAMLP